MTDNFDSAKFIVDRYKYFLATKYPNVWVELCKWYRNTYNNDPISAGKLLTRHSYYMQKKYPNIQNEFEHHFTNYIKTGQ